MHGVDFFLNISRFAVFLQDKQLQAIFKTAVISIVVETKHSSRLFFLVKYWGILLV